MQSQDTQRLRRGVAKHQPLECQATGLEQAPTLEQRIARFASQTQHTAKRGAA